MVTKNADRIRELAMSLARENKKAEPGITRVYWFPDEREVRLIELEDGIPPSAGGAVEPFYFEPSLRDGLPAPSAIALIRSDEFRQLDLPDGWGDWESAWELEIEP
jgi:hypothetical protein